MIALISIILLSLLCTAFFAGSETAFIALFRKKEGLETFPKKIGRWLDEPEELFSVTLIGTNIFIVIASSISTLIFSRYFGEKGELYSLITISIVTLIFCEILPKSFALSHSEPFAKLATPFLDFSSAIFKPLSYLTNRLSLFALSVIRNIFVPSKTYPMAEFEKIAREGQLDIGSDRHSLLLSMLELSKKTAFDFMIPKGRIPHILRKTSVETAIECAKTSGEKLFIVETENGEIDGIARLSDLLALPGFLVDDATRPPFFVPENASILKVFAELSDSRNEIALVVDEHGAITGAVFLKRLQDYFSGKLNINEQDRNVEEIIIVHGLSLIEEVEYLIEDKMPKGPYRTLAGFIEEMSHEIPRTNHSIIWKNWRFTIIERDERVIKKIKIERIS